MVLPGKLTKKLVVGTGRHGDGNGLYLVVDPSGACQEVPTLEEVAQQVHVDRMPPWKNVKHGQQPNKVRGEDIVTLFFGGRRPCALMRKLAIEFRNEANTSTNLRRASPGFSRWPVR